jgi:hypothetical protein
VGGPWKDTEVKAGEPSDAYLMHGYENRALTIDHNSKVPVKFTIEMDVLGTGQWAVDKVIEVKPGEKAQHVFDRGNPARWVRLKSDQACQVTAIFKYD